MHLHASTIALSLAILTFATPTLAQFNFFENIFQGQQQFHQQQQQPQEAPSDSEWYGRVWLDSELSPPLPNWRFAFNGNF
jgi:hypothetical protein